jgi:cysteine-rich repeat protein
MRIPADNPFVQSRTTLPVRSDAGYARQTLNSLGRTVIQMGSKHILRAVLLAVPLALLACGTEWVEVDSTVSGIPPAGSDAFPVANDIPLAMAPGERLRVNVTMQNNGAFNDGSNDWNSNYALHRTTTGWSWVYTQVAGTVTPGQQHAFSPIVITAPTNPGTYTFGAQMRLLGDQTFGTPLTVPNIVVSGAVTPQYSCTWDQVNSTFSTTMTPGELQLATFRLQNTGAATWDAAGPGTCLRSRDTPSQFWGSASNCVYIPANVLPGGTVDITVPIRAPATAGTYSFDRQMYDFTGDGVGFFSLAQNCIDSSITVGGAAVLDASLVSQNFPTPLAPGETRTVMVVMQNDGTETWLADGNYALGSQNNPTSLFGVTLVPVGANTASGSQNTFTFNVTAPTTPGNYNYRFRMRKLSGTNAGFFGDLIDVPMTVDGNQQAQTDAALVSQTIPARVTAGEMATFTIVMQNNGVRDWVGASFGLHSTNTPIGLWTDTSDVLGAAETVPSGANRTFTLNVTAPATAGFYDSRWRMREIGGVGFFGDEAVTTNIEVTLCGNNNIDAGETCDDGNLVGGDACSATCVDETVEVDLVNGSGRTFIGSNSLKQLASVSIGDVTNDGVPEVVMAEISNVVPTYSTFRNQAGKVFGYDTSGNFLNGSSTVVPNGSPSFQIWGRDAGDRLGLVASNKLLIGDVTGDGIEDLVVGAPDGDGPLNDRTSAGEVYVIQGGAALATAGIIDLARNHALIAARIYGPTAGDMLRTLALGDLTGDGVADLVLGATGDDTGATDAGAVWVLEGGIDLVATSTVDLAAVPAGVTAFRIAGLGNGGVLGGNAAVGDFGDTAAADLVIGNANHMSNGLTNAGAAWGFFGPLTGGETLGAADVLWLGQSDYAKLGSSVEIGNVLGDNTSEVVIGSVQHRKADLLQYGAVDVWAGPITPGTTFDVSLGATPAARILGADQFDSLGQSIGLGDYNSDGFLDVAVGASTADGPGNTRERSGEVSVLLGGTLLPAETDLATANPILLIYGARTRDLLGHQTSMISMGDIDGDGSADICVGAQLGGTGTLFQGRIDCIASNL